MWKIPLSSIKLKNAAPHKRLFTTQTQREPFKYAYDSSKLVFKQPISKISERQIGRIEKSVSILMDSLGPQNWVSVIRMKRTKPINVPHLTLAMRWLQYKHPLLRTCISMEEDPVFNVAVNSPAVHWIVRTQEEQWQKVAKLELNHSTLSPINPPIRLALLAPADEVKSDEPASAQPTEHSFELVMSISQLVADGMNATNLLKEFLLLWKSLEDGVADLPKGANPIMNCMDEFLPDEAFKSNWRYKLFQFKRNMLDWPQGHQVDDDDVVGSLETSSAAKFRNLSGKDTSLLRYQCKHNGVSVNDALGAASVYAASDVIMSGAPTKKLWFHQQVDLRRRFQEPIPKKHLFPCYGTLEHTVVVPTRDRHSYHSKKEMMQKLSSETENEMSGNPTTGPSTTSKEITSEMFWKTAKDLRGQTEEYLHKGHHFHSLTEMVDKNSDYVEEIEFTDAAKIAANLDNLGMLDIPEDVINQFGIHNVYFATSNRLPTFFVTSSTLANDEMGLAFTYQQPFFSDLTANTYADRFLLYLQRVLK